MERIERMPVLERLTASARQEICPLLSTISTEFGDRCVLALDSARTVFRHDGRLFRSANDFGRVDSRDREISREHSLKDSDRPVDPAGPMDREMDFDFDCSFGRHDPY